MDRREINDSPVENGTSSDKFVLHARLPTLQEMAYNQIAIAVWYGYRSTPRQRHYEQWHVESIDKLELMDCHKLIKTLTMPRFMKENLKKYLKRVRKETIRCTQYFKYELLPTNIDWYRIRQVDWEYFVWRPDGRIDYKSTAMKMLNSPVLIEVQKFAIMSDFCLENEIKIFDLNRLPMESFIRKVNGDRDHLLFYWICYLWHKTHGKIPFSTRSPTHYDRFICMYQKNHGEGFEYFWNFLNAGKQVSFINSKLCAYEYSKDWHYSIFCKMSHDQLTKLLFCEPSAMISVFIKRTETLEWAIRAWKRCQNCISNEHFVKLLQNVLDKFDKNLILHQERRMSVLLEIWNTANDHHRDYAATQLRLEEAAVRLILSANLLRTHIVLDEPFFWKKLAPSSFKFLLNFLSLKSADFRKKLILRGDLSFIFNFDLNVVQEIFELCLPNFQGKLEFKDDWSIKHIIDSYFGGILYSEEDHDELNRRLLRSFQNLNISLNHELKKFIEGLIIANKSEFQTYYPSNSNNKGYLLMKLSKFTKKILQENVPTVMRMKESYFSSFSAHSDPYERYGSLSELSKLIEQEFVHEHLQKLKHRLAEILQTSSVKQWVSYVLNYEKFNCVFSWCYENEKFLRAKPCIPINNIVRKVLERIVRQNTSSFCFISSTFSNLERFLEWYFSGVPEKVASFKSGVMNDPDTAKILLVEYTPENEIKKWIRRKFLQWNWPVQHIYHMIMINNRDVLKALSLS